MDTAPDRVRSMLRLVEDDIHELPTRILRKGPNETRRLRTGTVHRRAGSSLALLGISTVAGQFLAPVAGDPADDAHRGRVVGTVASGVSPES